MTRDIEAALNNIVNTTEQSRNMRKELKKKIYETASTLRILFMTSKVELEEGKSKKEGLESELRDAKTLRKDSNMVEEESKPETSSDRGGKLQQQ